MNDKRIVFWVFMVLLMGNQAAAKGWISVEVPTAYRFASEETSPFAFNTRLTGTPAGYIIYGSIFKKPFLGYENLQIHVDTQNSDTPTALIEIQFIDIGLYFQQKNSHLLLGIGQGSYTVKCQINACSNYSFKEGSADQVFIQLGVVLINTLDFSLGLHRITGSNTFKVDSESDDMVLDGMMVTAGLNYNW